METRLLQKNKDNTTASLILKGTSYVYLNLFRRIIADFVPTMAIETVELKKNSSLLYDEIIAHRLGLLVLKTKLKGYNETNKCPCKGEGCSRCQLKLTLKAKGPCTVYASDIKSKDPKVKPVHPKTPVVRLLSDQEIDLIATAQLGCGYEHSKWSPGLVYYRHKPLINVKDVKKAEELVKSCPANIYELKNNKLSINKDNLLECHLCNACIDLIKEEGLSVKESESDFIFNIESWGSLNTKEIILKSVEVINEQLDDFTKELKKIKS